MREILFRGKRLDNGEWVEGYLGQDTIMGNKKTWIGHVIKPVPKKLYEFDSFEVDPDTIGQFTGLLDKAGKRIFEGDIVSFGANVYVVKYIEKYSRFAGTMPGIVFSGFPLANSIVIGNIHDEQGLRINGANLICGTISAANITIYGGDTDGEERTE